MKQQVSAWAESRKQVTVFGSYNRQSVGDRAILLGLLYSLYQEAGRTLSVKVLAFDAVSIERELSKYSWAEQMSVVSLTGPLKDQRSIGSSIASVGRTFWRRLPRWMRHGLDTMQFLWTLRRDFVGRSECLLIGGGNLFMDYFYQWPFKLWAMCREFNRRGLPVVILGIGVGPISTSVGRYLLGSVVRTARVVGVRDRVSAGLCQTLWNTECSVYPDFAFSCPIATDECVLNYDDGYLACNVAGVFSKSWPYSDAARYERFASQFANGVHQHFARTTTAKYLQFFDTNYPTDRYATRDVIRRLIELGVEARRIRYDDRLLTVGEVAAITKGAKACLTTRLHAAILALKTDTPLVAIEYQEKVGSVLSLVDMSECVIGLGELHGLTDKLKLAEQAPDRMRIAPSMMRHLESKCGEAVRHVLRTGGGADGK